MFTRSRSYTIHTNCFIESRKTRSRYSISITLRVNLAKGAGQGAKITASQLRSSHAALRRRPYNPIRRAIIKQVTVSVLGEPFRTCEMALPDTACSGRLAHRVDLEHQESCLIPL